MNIFDQLQFIRDSVAPWSTAFEVHTSRSLIVCRRYPNASNEYLEITPRPIIENVSANLVERYQGVNGIQIELSNLQISGISKKYDRAQLVNRMIYYIIDGQLVNGLPVGGIEYDIIPGFDLIKEPTTWSIVVRQRNQRGGV